MLSPRKTKIAYFRSRVCIWVSDAPVTSHLKPADQAFSSIPILMRHFLARLLPFSVILNCHAESELPDDKSCQKAALQTFREECIYRNVSVHRTMLSAAPAFGDFCVTHGGMSNIT